MGTGYAKIQLLTIADLLAGKAADVPASSVTFKQAAREKSDGGVEQLGLDL